MNELQLFNFESHEVRTLSINGEIWFVGKDVAETLGYANPQKAIRDHVDEEDRGLNEMVTPSGNQQMVIINESGLYSLTLSSKLESAKRFKRWVTSEVLPTIRKTGGVYMTQTKAEELLADPDLIIGLAQQVKDLKLNNSRLSVEVATMQPKADYFDALVDRGLNLSIRDTAKGLKIKEKEFVAWLLKKKFLYRSGSKGKLTPYAEYVDDLFEIKESTNNKTGWAGTQTLVTPKGRETFKLLTEGM